MSMLNENEKVRREKLYRKLNLFRYNNSSTDFSEVKGDVADYLDLVAKEFDVDSWEYLPQEAFINNSLLSNVSDWYKKEEERGTYFENN